MAGTAGIGRIYVSNWGGQKALYLHYLKTYKPEKLTLYAYCKQGESHARFREKQQAN
jgi:ribosomal protein L33